MALLMENCQFAEVLVQRYQYASLEIGKPQDLLIARVIAPLSGPQHIVTGGHQNSHAPTPYTGVQTEAGSSFRVDGEGLNALTRNYSAGVDQTRLYVGQFQPGIAGEYDLWTITGCQHPQNVFHRQPPTPNDWLSSEDSGVSSYSFQELGFFH